MGEVELQPLTAAHLPGVEALVMDPDVLRFTGVPNPVPPGWVRGWVRSYEEGRRTGAKIGFAAVDGDGTLLGLGLAPRIDHEARELELGYMVAPEWRGRGVATDILRQLTRWALHEHGALRVTLRIDVANDGSLRVAERCGYVREGVLRQQWLKDDVRIDTVLLSRLASDPGPL